MPNETRVGMPASYIDWQQQRGWTIQCERCAGSGEIVVWGARVASWPCSACNGTGEQCELRAGVAT